MSPTRGARITVESEKVGAPQREGEILEVIESEISVRYRVRWDDGKETTFRPAAGSVIVGSGARHPGAPGATTAKKPKKKGKAKNAKGKSGSAKKATRTATA